MIFMKHKEIWPNFTLWWLWVSSELCYGVHSFQFYYIFILRIFVSYIQILPLCGYVCLNTNMSMYITRQHTMKTYGGV
jgi:hypothetical protein